jgi:nucleotide-binding universal stress UspA family protein
VYRQILVGYRHSDEGEDALVLGRTMARACEARMIVITAPGEHGENLAALARERQVDLIVLGTTHRGSVGRVFPGATVERLLGDPPCAIVVAPPGFARPMNGSTEWRPLSESAEGDVGMRVIGVGYDSTAASRAAIEAATELALRNGATLRVYSVARTYPHVPGASGDERGPGVPSEAELIRAQLHGIVASLPPAIRAQAVFLRGFAADELIEATRSGVDLLVLGSRRGGPLRRAFHKSVTATVMQHAGCPVLITPSAVVSSQPVWHSPDADPARRA